MTEIDPKLLKKVVGRQVRNLPLDDDEPQIRSVKDGRICHGCGIEPVSEPGTEAGAKGLCPQCWSWERRHGELS